ncbi:MAG: response regulator [Saprospiraceae bacterium]
MSRLFRNTILIIFIIALMIIVFLQYGSDYNIRQLIVGNENLLESLQLKNNLQKVQTGIVSLESKVRAAIIRGKIIDTNHLNDELKNIQETIGYIDTLDTDSLTFSLINDLKSNIKKRTLFYTALLDTFRLKGKLPAEKMANSHPDRFLADSLRTLVFKIDSVHKLHVISLIRIADKNATKAKTLSTILSLIAIIVCLFTFGYVSYKVKEQQILIEKLNESEKKIKEAIRVKEKFLANMSHEIRTPLNSIQGFTELLEKKDLSVELKEFVSYIKTSSDNLYKIVNDILDTSKIEAGMMRIESVPFKLSEIINQIDTIFNKKFAENLIGWNRHVDPNIPDQLIGDPTRLTQILSNILSNALKFTHKGMVRLDISLSSRSGMKVVLSFTINDSGIGILPEMQTKLFERFQQADDSITRKYGGSGLGLAITKELVELQEGTISMDSLPGQGSTFTVKIPYFIHVDSLEKSSLNSNPTELTNELIHKATILLVEDNATNQVLMKHFINQYHMECDIASNGNEAIARIKEKKYDIILMDIQMPEMDGYTATKIIRQELKLEIPIIAMTAFAFENERDKCIASGMNEYLSKPVRLENLLEIVRRYTKVDEKNTNHIPGKLSYTPTTVVDMKYLDKISPDNQEFKQNILSQFTDQVPLEIMTLEKNLKDNDIQSFKKTAHRMKSTFSIAGPDSEIYIMLDSFESTASINELTCERFEQLKKLTQLAIEEAYHFLKV